MVGWSTSGWDVTSRSKWVKYNYGNDKNSAYITDYYYGVLLMLTSETDLQIMFIFFKYLYKIRYFEGSWLKLLVFIFNLNSIIQFCNGSGCCC